MGEKTQLNMSRFIFDFFGYRHQSVPRKKSAREVCEVSLIPSTIVDTLSLASGLVLGAFRLLGTAILSA